ncbi:ABC transporter permease [Paraneptunicella aestuarii]|uniref:ABC transporter permease n=1 Tax=Paraneptunicella aestuarii TaxID=2831148 RepID=UPI001E4186EC|nr:ABC transporter permease [Paraneptunicella aestuarii]UAA39463.1 ABC transporter permease [Paraneptunicella aestuarii]
MNHSIYLLKQAWAGLSAKKGFLVTIVTTLGLTLGALLCILTLAYVVISKPLPYPEQENLYQVNSVIVDKNRGVIARAYNYPTLVNFFEKQTVFSLAALVRYEDGVLSSQPTQPTVRNTFVTPDWFPMMGATMAMGRAFESTEEKDSYNPVAILSYEFWQNEFNSDTSILERSVTLGGTNFRVVGVMAKSFIEPQLAGTGVKTDIFLPWDFNTLDAAQREGFGSFSVMSRFVGKLDSDRSISQIEQELRLPVNDFWRGNVAEIARYDNWTLDTELQSFKTAILGDSKNTVLLLLAGVIGLVLIACTNITNLFMSRTADQQRELAIHAAVGASKRHLFQTLFSQSGLVVFLSVLVALIIASAGFWVLKQYLALRLPRVDELAINSVTLIAALIIALLLGLLFARISASMINYRALNATLQSSGKGTGIQVSKTVRRLLIISQVSIVTLLVFVSIGLLRDSLKAINEPLGFETDNITALTLKINSSSNLSEEEIKPLMLEFKNRLMELPQVADVSQAVLPLGRARRINQGVEGSQELQLIETRFIDNRYFQIIEQPLIEGDFFSAADFNDESSLIIVNDSYAAQLAGEGSALGSKIVLGGTTYTVSGVVKGVKMPTANDIPVRAYLPLAEARPQFIVKLKPNQTLSRESAAKIAQEVNRQLLLSELETLNDQRDELLFTQYTTAITSSVLAVLTFFLATIGLYGILSYATQMRRFELGTRLAIGAKRNDVIALIIKDNASSVAIGFVISLVILLGLYIGFSEALVNYVNVQIVPLYAGTLVLISIMTLFACYWPLRSIINARPIHSLRGSQ